MPMVVNGCRWPWMHEDLLEESRGSAEEDADEGTDLQWRAVEDALLRSAPWAAHGRDVAKDCRVLVGAHLCVCAHVCMHPMRLGTGSQTCMRSRILRSCLSFLSSMALCLASPSHLQPLSCRVGDNDDGAQLDAVVRLDIQRLQAAIEKLPEGEAMSHLWRCGDSGLWVPTPARRLTTRNEGVARSALRSGRSNAVS